MRRGDAAVRDCARGSGRFVVHGILPLATVTSMLSMARVGCDVLLEVASRLGDLIEDDERALRRPRGGEGAQLGFELAVDEVAVARCAATELKHHDVAEHRLQIGQHAVDAVAKAARRAALLLVFEGAQLRADGGRHGGPFGDAERAQQIGPLGAVAFGGERLRVLGRGLHDAARDVDRVADAAHGEHAAQHLVPASAGCGIRREALGHADVTLGVPRGLLGDREVDARALRDQPCDVRDVGLTQTQRADAGADRGQEVGVTRCAQHPHGPLRRLLERLEQHVGGALDHAVGILHDDDPVPSERRAEVGALDQRTARP